DNRVLKDYTLTHPILREPQKSNLRCPNCLTLALANLGILHAAGNSRYIQGTCQNRKETFYAEGARCILPLRPKIKKGIRVVAGGNRTYCREATHESRNARNCSDFGRRNVRLGFVRSACRDAKRRLVTVRCYCRFG